jgi:homoserine kinase
MWKIVVPATSANLGSGFDVLGIAVALYATFSIEEHTHTELIGFNSSISHEDNLFLKSYRFSCLKEGYPEKTIKVHFQTDIPMSRGLGSSSSLIVAGGCAAQLIHTQSLDKMVALSHAVAIEGHPDNVAPCLFGGLISTSFINQQWQIQKYPLHQDLKWTFLIPDFELLTSVSRSVLPNSYPQETLDVSKDKLKKLLIGLETANMAYIQDGCDDVLHQPYRFKLIHDIDDIQTQIDNTSALYLSGAGPALAIISKSKVNLDLKNLHSNWTIKELQIDTKGVTII